ncbi:FISUMP domain-containing protein [Rhodanobacter spathiphylli]|uniref:FISUMP domain-containing protein n=1 Tax=Rhodanobacter spathiphylli TaxID=347483 RepID=UPI00138991A4|nr:FISUMP domain-containing protein [Rhodanobacter spathiphylli]
MNENEFESGCSYLMIRCPVDAFVIVDGVSLGEVFANIFKHFEVNPGEHVVQLLSLDGALSWEGQRHIPPGEQIVIEPSLLPTDKSIGVPGKTTDTRDGKVYSTVLIEGKEWFSQNYAFDHPGSSAPGNSVSQIAANGRIYPYNLASQLAPNGWRLPTEADVLALLSLYKDPIDDLLAGGKSGLNITLPGCRDFAGGFGGIGNSCLIWTSTVGSPWRDVTGKAHPTQKYLAFDLQKKSVYIEEFVGAQWNSVRYVRQT